MFGESVERIAVASWAFSVPYFVEVDGKVRMDCPEIIQKEWNNVQFHPELGLEIRLSTDGIYVRATYNVEPKVERVASYRYEIGR